MTIAVAFIPCLAETGTAVSGADPESVDKGRIKTAGARTIGEGVSVLVGM